MGVEIPAAVSDRPRVGRHETVKHAQSGGLSSAVWAQQPENRPLTAVEIEPIDETVLGDPQAHIIEPGGDILFARLGETLVGACALRHEGDGRYELTKMCVTPAAQGSGAGRRLRQASIERFHALEGRELYLFTNSSLGPAIHLYETEGFEHRPLPVPTPYARSDVYMVLSTGGGD